MKSVNLILLLMLFIVLSASPANAQGTDFAVKDKILYVGADNFLMVYDCTDPAKAKFVQSLTFPDKVSSVTIMDSSLFVAVNWTGLFLFNIPDLKSQTIKAKYLYKYLSFTFDGKTIYYSQGDTLKRISITDKQTFEVKDSAEVQWPSGYKAIKNNRLYNLMETAIGVYDISDLKNIKLLKTVTTPFYTASPIAVVNNYLYVGQIGSYGPRTSISVGEIYEISDSSGLIDKFRAGAYISLEAAKNDYLYGLNTYRDGYDGPIIVGLDAVNLKTGEFKYTKEIDQHASSLRLSEDGSTIYLYSGNSPYPGGATGKYITIYSLTSPLTLQSLGSFKIYIPVGVKEEGAALKSYSLSQNYPNPFNPTTQISYSIPKESYVELKVFDMLGREIQTLVSKEQSQGDYEVQFNASSLPSGMYIYTIKAGEFTSSKKLLLVK